MLPLPLLSPPITLSYMDGPQSLTSQSPCTPQYLSDPSPVDLTSATPSQSTLSYCPYISLVHSQDRPLFTLFLYPSPPSPSSSVDHPLELSYLVSPFLSTPTLPRVYPTTPPTPLGPASHELTSTPFSFHWPHLPSPPADSSLLSVHISLSPCSSLLPLTGHRSFSIPILVTLH